MRLDHLKALIVDDNRHSRLLLAQILRAVGPTHVIEAEDGEAGLAAMRLHAIDVVLTDLAMEPMDGIEFVRRLRRSPDNAMAPVIMVTAHSTLKHIRDARDAGVSEFVTKPITARAVIERLQQVLGYARPFVRSDSYFGPDRRRRADPRHAGPWRRACDGGNVRALEI